MILKRVAHRGYLLADAQLHHLFGNYITVFKPPILNEIQYIHSYFIHPRSLFLTLKTAFFIC